MYEEIKNEGDICKEGGGEPQTRMEKVNNRWTIQPMPRVLVTTQFLNNENDLELGGVLETVLSHLS